MMIFTGWQGNRLYYKQAVRVFVREKMRLIMRRRISYNLRGGASVAGMIGLQVIVGIVFGGAMLGLSLYQLSRILKRCSFNW